MSTVSSEIRDDRRSGAVDSVMFSHSDLISRWAVIVFESWYIFSFFNFWLFLCQFYVEHFFHSPAKRISDRKAIRS